MGIAGLGAGAVQVMIGSQIPEWSGAKASPTGLGLLTIGLSLLAGFAAVRQSTPGLTAWGRTACALGLLVPGLLCLSTVGRPVNDRATRMASSVDSVPEPVNFTCSADGTSRLTSSAQRTSSSWPAP